MAVAQELTDLWQWRAGAKQFRGYSVAQTMCTDVAEARATSGRGNDFAHPNAAKSPVGCSNAHEHSTVYGRCRPATAQIGNHGLTNVYRPR
jgi:hypothetical protein